MSVSHRLIAPRSRGSASRDNAWSHDCSGAVSSDATNALRVNVNTAGDGNDARRRVVRYPYAKREKGLTFTSGLAKGEIDVNAKLRRRREALELVRVSPEFCLNYRKPISTFLLLS